MDNGSPRWLISQRAARALCGRCGELARTEDAHGRLWCEQCWQARTGYTAEQRNIPDALEVTGPNLWAVRTEPGEDGLTTFTHLSGPGIAGVIGARR